MTRRDECVLLWDIVTHSEAAAAFLGRLSEEEYAADPMRQSAVERQLIVVGEAYGTLDRCDPVLAERLPGDTRAVVGMRNLLVHGYEWIQPQTVHRVVTEDLPLLIEAARRLLEELDSSR